MVGRCDPIDQEHIRDRTLEAMGAKALVRKVARGSVAERWGIRPGDRLLSLNGNRLRDVFDYQLLIQEPELELLMQRDGNLITLHILKEESQDLGIEFENSLFDGVKKCNSNCLFCFVDQMPNGLRRTLYFKDDDYRLSFLHGNFITLNNLIPEEAERIVKFRISPLYVSLHSTSPQVRSFLMGTSRAEHGLRMLQYLDCQGVSTNIQIVLCPGINDGTVLESTLADLLFKYNHINTVGIVPVARGNHFHGHPRIVNCTPEKAGELIETVERWQQAFRAKRGRNTVFAADEFFVLTRKPFPERTYYDHFEQLENGIGLCRLFMDEAEAYLEKMLSQARIGGGAEKRAKMTIRAPSLPLLIVTGITAKPVLSEVLQKVLSIYQMDVELLAVPNSSLGPRITVTGLLFGKDIIEALSSSDCAKRVVLLPDIIFNSYGRTLDGMSLHELKENTGLSIRVVRSEGKAFVQSIPGRNTVGGKRDHDLSLESDTGKTATMVKSKEEIAHVCHQH
ncbi:hypothetical protein HKBW3S43_00131 [Candidatus Hakubella thermalkaliphila]|uniref:PDZ domain-containing protein n=2 Tax=Candidatus Hakubella thermalkaliphila TaxID=2754717 RepID=A0A6V8PPW4_9ACTN|nr:hypothetical protein HKBW3S43_00131 [Candidatus Hakubella thermalkaliphila]